MNPHLEARAARARPGDRRTAVRRRPLVEPDEAVAAAGTGLGTAPVVRHPDLQIAVRVSELYGHGAGG
jgi:hypothetical protein